MEVTDSGSFARGRYLSKNVDAIDSSGSMDGLIGCKILPWCYNAVDVSDILLIQLIVMGFLISNKKIYESLFL